MLVRSERPGADFRVSFGLWWLGLAQHESVLGSGRMFYPIDRRLASTIATTGGGGAIGTGLWRLGVLVAVVGALWLRAVCE